MMRHENSSTAIIKAGWPQSAQADALKVLEHEDIEHQFQLAKHLEGGCRPFRVALVSWEKETCPPEGPWCDVRQSISQTSSIGLRQ
ncbi:hypothetical protein PM082_009475 [Marasmius tenuissimus]|nr:hypothetical protein PM082_009475 [Marasmius tenuissimus]